MDPMTRAARLFSLLLAAAPASGCSSSNEPAVPSASTTSSSGGAGGAAAAPTTFGGDRPVTLHVPASYRPGTPTPLVLLLHGYSVSGLVEDLYMGFTALSDARGFLYAHPDGTVDSKKNHFWNATDACCNVDGSKVDDSAYLSDLIAAIGAAYSVDPKRIFLAGHSNGGFMSYRMACDHADQIAAIASLAGAMWLDTSKCKPAAPVSVLEIHGTADTEVLYGGTAQYPSAEVTVKDWASIDGCGAMPDTSLPPLDLDDNLAGAETSVTRYGGCKGGAAELWTLLGGTHVPGFTDASRAKIVDFLYAHPKP
jgi:polyhydroxybutyrate depolymerase